MLTTHVKEQIRLAKALEVPIYVVYYIESQTISGTEDGVKEFTTFANLERAVEMMYLSIKYLRTDCIFSEDFTLCDQVDLYAGTTFVYSVKRDADGQLHHTGKLPA